MTEEQTKKEKKNLKSLLNNYWAISTIVLAIILIVTLITPNGTTGMVSANQAGQNVLEFANNQGANAELISTENAGTLYQVTLSIEGQEVPIYVTKDGENLVPQLIPLTTQATTDTTTPTSTSTNIPKSDKPLVEAFVMSHCPYGTQIEKGLIPVMKLLGDKIDAEIKFVYYAMHPTYGEVEEQLNQYCIQEEQNDKFLDYLTCFLGKTGTSEDGQACITETGIDKTKLASCTTKTDKEFEITKNLEDKSLWLKGPNGEPRFPNFNIHKTENDKYGIGGSPTLVINGVTAQAGRDSASLLNAICATFETAPEECNEDLSELGNPSPGFGFNTQGGATQAGCGV